MPDLPLAGVGDRIARGRTAWREFIPGAPPGATRDVAGNPVWGDIGCSVSSPSTSGDDHEGSPLGPGYRRPVRGVGAAGPRPVPQAGQLLPGAQRDGEDRKSVV